jgi:flagellar motility protein MotE (MotC chaperone)
MKKYVLNAVLLLVASAQLVGLAQDATKTSGTKPAEKPVTPAVKPAEKPAENKSTEKAEEKKSTNRLPSNYGKLGLTDAQKSKIYGVQDKHEKEIDGLNEKLKAAKAKRDAEVEAVLTPAQKKALKEIIDAKEDAKDGK